MFRKLASLLFEEEEIIVEEEELQKDPQDKHYEIPPIKGIKASETTESNQTIKKEVKEKEIQKPEKEKIERFDEELSLNNSKIQRIDVEDPIEKARKEKKLKKKKLEKVIQEDIVYEPQEIISPMFGGDEKKKEPIKIPAVRKQSEDEESGIISPMYGKVQRDVKKEPAEEILNLDLEDMVQPKGDNQEIQVSLYDYLEELEDEK